MCTLVCVHVYRHVYIHVHGHVYGHVHGHLLQTIYSISNFEPDIRSWADWDMAMEYFEFD